MDEKFKKVVLMVVIGLGLLGCAILASAQEGDAVVGERNGIESTRLMAPDTSGVDEDCDGRDCPTSGSNGLDDDCDGPECSVATPNGEDNDCDGVECTSAVAPSEPMFCTADAKVCSDGSYVGRTGPDCAFAACPRDIDDDDMGDVGVIADEVCRGGDCDDDDPQLRGGYIKIDDIKGEVSERLDTDDDGDSVDTEDDMAQKRIVQPREIHAVGEMIREEIAAGNQVRGWDPKNKEVILRVSEIQTEEDLEDYTKALLMKGDEVESMSVRGERVHMTSTQPVKLFGFIGMSMTQEVIVDSASDGEDRVEVDFPWWSFLAKKTVSSSDIETTLEEGLAAETQVEGEGFSMVSSIMKSSHDTMMNIIRNMK